MNIESSIELGRMVAFSDTSYGNDTKDIILYCGDYRITIGVQCISIEQMHTPNSYASFPTDNVVLDAEQEPNGFTAFHFDTNSMSLTIEFTNKAVARVFKDNEMVQEEQENLLETLLQAE